MKNLSITRRKLQQYFRNISLLGLLLFLLACQEEDEPAAQIPTEPSGKIQISVINDEVGGVPVVLAGSGVKNLLVSFERTTTEGELLDFSPVQDALPDLLIDQDSNVYNIFGQAVRGPNEGRQLQSTYGMMGFWFTFGAFYNNLEIYGQAGSGKADVEPTPTEAWAVPQEEVLKITTVDAIPALDEPSFTNAPDRPNLPGELGILEDNDLLLGIAIGDEIRLYPHRILDWHEIANDKIYGEPFSIIYCPLTGTGSGWSRMLNGQETTFGVSGMLYNTNIIPYDRQSGSLWSQMVGSSISGRQIGKEQPRYHLVETTWSEWRQMISSPKVLSFKTGYNRKYEFYPYGDYRTNHEAINFPVSHLDDRLPAKERVHFVSINGQNKAYRFSDF